MNFKRLSLCKIFNEFNELLEQIKALLDILQTPDLLMDVIRKELTAVSYTHLTLPTKA